MSGMLVRAPALARLPAIRHGFFTRQGGVSGGPFEALNCGFSGGDEPAHVERNRALALAALGLDPKSLATARQVHGAEVVVAREPRPGRPERAADALVTDRPGVSLGVLSADCAPVLFADPAAGVIGAAHAGWRGARSGVLEATIAAMVRLGAQAERVTACVGPCIAQASYEVGPEMQAQFLRQEPASERHFQPVPDSDRLLFDLEGYALARLARAGVVAREGLGEDTRTQPERFFSSRRSRLAGEERFGLLISVIALSP